MEKLKITPEEGYDGLVWTPKSLKVLEDFVNNLADENQKLREAVRYLARQPEFMVMRTYNLEVENNINQILGE